MCFFFAYFYVFFFHFSIRKSWKIFEFCFSILHLLWLERVTTVHKQNCKHICHQCWWKQMKYLKRRKRKEIEKCYLYRCSFYLANSTVWMYTIIFFSLKMFSFSFHSNEFCFFFAFILSEKSNCFPLLCFYIALERYPN